MGDYEDALADLQVADRATHNHENILGKSWVLLLMKLLITSAFLTSIF